MPLNVDRFPQAVALSLPPSITSLKRLKSILRVAIS
jgi:hypothetical protein